MADFNSELPLEMELAPGASRPPSLSRQSASRFLADTAGLVFAVLSGVVVARSLGPTGKGLFSSLTLLAGIVLWICSLGLGDAAVVMVGQKKASMQQALSATMGAAFLLSAVGAALVWAAALFAFGQNWDEVRSAAGIACVGLPLGLLVYNLGHLLIAQERVAAQSAVIAVTAVVTSLALVLFVAIVDLSVAGGVIANGVGSIAGLVVAWRLLRRSGLSFRPRFDLAYLVPAARYGVSVAFSYVLTVMLLRVDMLLTYALAGSEAAGQYSVALSLSALVGLLPVAISAATFPRLARIDEATAKELTAQSCRYGAAAALSVAVAFLVIVPVAVPLLFGPAFRPAVVPTLILLPSGVFWSAQWILCRSAAARGWPGLLLRTFLLSLLVMCGLDLLLIPWLGTVGAALSAVAGPAAGLAWCLVSYRRSPAWSLRLGSLVPRIGDFRAFASQSLQLLPFPKR
ncbi:MAG TPA: oligosaccharide flippase family protein [Acidimicrobiales bacterium]|nr:oligosaccharide flippase family protein [Acidimicrobiales bacterium]